MIDEFYNNIYSDLFLHWVLCNQKEYQSHNIECHISRQDELGTSISFECKDCNGKVTVWENNIVEQEIYSNKDHQLLFYLHFILLEINQFRSLFYEFYNALLKMNNKKEINIAFCCTGGLSTSLFVSELLEVCKLQKIDYQLKSVPIEELFKDKIHYDAIYLAPQISHLQPELLRKTRHIIPIHRIDPTVFATKNYQKILKTIHENLIYDAIKKEID